eukprot:TRINITY_DN6216_c1_g1_i1.p1 TRINITY_DN6216_c1_g1~~TRINITY_DN6216_c1_g1_i1.p1  ORF type:complete len:401 (+),score=85.31 TRINITY_DN6216_c1_g1_i1:68-1270(+)
MAAVPASASEAFLKGIAYSHTPSEYVSVNDGAAASRTKPLLAPLVTRRKLNEAGSNKTTAHYTFLLNKGTKYEAGDSLGVMPLQGTDLVEKTLKALNLDKASPVGHKRIKKGADMPAAMLLAQYLDIRNIPPALAKLSKVSELKEMKKDSKKYLEHLQSMELYDFAGKYLKDVPSADIIKALKPLQPRLYSISSSQAMAGETVDLTVAKVDYTTHGIERNGTATHFLHHLPLGAAMTPVFIQKAPKFRPPTTNIPAIMIGPGTGIAPFRAFMQDPKRMKAGAENWVFFGDQKPADYLYKSEWEALKEKGLLKMSTAFSRDPNSKKTYVQDRITEQGKEIWDWIANKKSQIFICGDAKAMAPGVEKALIGVFCKYGGMTQDQAATHLKDLEKSHRFHKDVY